MPGPIGRRGFLGLLAGASSGLAGCSLTGDDGVDGVETVTPVDVPTPEGVSRTTVGNPAVPGPGEWGTPPDGDLGVRRPAVVRFETGPRAVSVAPTRYRTIGGFVVAVRFVETATRESPARLQSLLYNGTARTETARLERLVPFWAAIPGATYEPPVGAPAAPGRDATLVLVPTRAHDLLDVDVAVARGQDGYWRAETTVAEASLPETVTLEPGEHVGGEFLLCGGPDSPGLPRGRYRFRVGATGTADDGPLTVVAWNPEDPGPRRRSQFAGAPAPAIRPDGPVQWFHRADGDTARYLLPDAETVSLPSLETIRLVDRGRVWRGGRLTISKRAGGNWYHVGPRPGVDVESSFGGIQPVRPDGVAAFSVWLTHDRPDQPVGRAIGFLGGGRYAFVVVPPDPSLPWHGALVDVDAPALSPRPQPDVTVERDGGTVLVTDPGVSDPSEATAVAVARRVPEADGRSLLPEQVVGQYGFGRALWNTLPLFEPGVGTVEYYAGGTLNSPAVATVLGDPLSFDGATVRVSLAPDA